MDEYQTVITSITLRRGPCFGACPIYEVTLAADGAATWYGERFADRLGRHQGQVDVHDFGRLARFMLRAGFLDWEPEYLGSVTDLPDYLLTAVGWRPNQDRAAERRRRTSRFLGDRGGGGRAGRSRRLDSRSRPGGDVPRLDCLSRSFAAGPVSSAGTGTCRFDTAGCSVELRRHEPQGINPRDLLLDCIVTPPDGPVAQVVAEVDVRYSEETELTTRQ